MPTVKFTRNLNRFYPNLKTVSSSGKTLEDVINDVDNQFPGIINYILDEHGSIRKHVQIFIQNQALQNRDELGTPVQASDEVYIMQALSGG